MKDQRIESNDYVISIPKFWAQIIATVLAALVLSVLYWGLEMNTTVDRIRESDRRQSERISELATKQELESQSKLTQQMFSEILRRFDRVEARIEND